MKTEMWTLLGTFLFVLATANGLRRTPHATDESIASICAKLAESGSMSANNGRWEKFCGKWLNKPAKREEDDEDMDERSMSEVFQQRKFGSSSSRSASRSSISRIPASRITGSRISSPVNRFVSTRTGARIIRPTGHIWSRTRASFLPVSSRYMYRSGTSRTRFTTPSTGSTTYYYCSSSAGATANEIQCTNKDGDSKCCEDPATQQPYCCGGDIDDDLDDDTNQAVQKWAKVFYTLAALAFFLHIVKKRFHL